MKAVDEGKTNKLLKAGSVLGNNSKPGRVVADSGMLKRLLAIMERPSHPLYDTLTRQRSLLTNRFTLPQCTTETQMLLLAHCHRHAHPLPCGPDRALIVKLIEMYPCLYCCILLFYCCNLFHCVSVWFSFLGKLKYSL